MDSNSSKSVCNSSTSWTTTAKMVQRFSRKSLANRERTPSPKKSEDGTKRRRHSLPVMVPNETNDAQPGTSGGDSKSKPYIITKYTKKLAASKPFLGFEIDDLKPVRRTVLDLDVRFFPTGLHPGSFLELKGEEGTGKTFLITYFLARTVLSSPIKTAVLIDTTHHFYLPTLISIISHFDKEIVLEKEDNIVIMNVADVIKANPKLTSYLERISIIKCYRAEELLVTLGPGHDSTLEKMLLTDPNLSLVAVDAIDSYTYIEGLKNAAVGLHPNFVHLIHHAVAATQTPVICSTINSSYNAGLNYKDKSKTDAQPQDTFAPSLTSVHANALPMNTNQAPSSSNQAQLPKAKDWFCNVIMDYSYFTHSMHLQNIENTTNPNRHLAIAYLRSKQSPKTALFSVVNHRAKFSIFSDMLYVDAE